MTIQMLAWSLSLGREHDQMQDEKTIRTLVLSLWLGSKHDAMKDEE